MATEEITIDTLVNAPLDAVWDRYTQPDHIIRWNFASDDWCCPRASNDLRVGGKMTSRMEAKDGSFGFDFEGTYTEVSQNAALAYALEDGREVRTTFVPEGDAVRVTTRFDAETENDLEMQRAGWQAILENFRRHAES